METMSDATTVQGLQTSGAQPRISPRLLDRIEQVVLIALWTWLVWRVAGSPNIFAWLAIASESVILFFLLFRRPTEAISTRAGDWFVAITATVAPMLLIMADSPLFGLGWLALALVIAGDAFQIWAKLVLRRSFGIAPANRGVKTGGPYALVRHPMYAGYIIAQVGVLIAIPSLFNLGVIALGWVAQVMRIRREEEMLMQDASYREMAARVPWRLFPGIW